MIVIPILAYHSISDCPHEGTMRWSVSPDEFDRQMALLRRRGHSPLTVGRYARLLRDGATLPPRPVVVTFDDGFADLVTAALPVLLRHGIVATAFVITDRIGTRGALSWRQLDELRMSGVEIGAHGMSHRALDCLPLAEIRREVAGSWQALEQRWARQAYPFAYPYGYHSAAVRREVLAAGFGSACAVKNALSHPHDDTYALARVLIQRDTTVTGLNELLNGRGYPVAWRGERWGTRAWRVWRRTQAAVAGVAAPPRLRVRGVQAPE